MLWGLYDLVFLIPLFLFITYDFVLGVLLLVGAYVGLTYLAGNLNLVEIGQWFGGHVSVILYMILAYVVIGIGWSFLKWKLLIRKFVRNIKEVHQVWIDHGKAFEFEEYYSRTKAYAPYTEYPRSIHASEIRMSDYKAVITEWIAFWWFSLIQTFFGEWVVIFFNGIYNLFVEVYASMMKSEFNSLNFDK